MKRIIGILGFTSFIVMYLTFGAIQSDNIPLAIGIIICFACLALLGLTVYISKNIKPNVHIIENNAEISSKKCG